MKLKFSDIGKILKCSESVKWCLYHNFSNSGISFTQPVICSPEYNCEVTRWLIAFRNKLKLLFLSRTA